MLAISLIVIAGLLRGQSNPKCKAKRYQCSPEPLPSGTCLFIQDKQEKFNYVWPCSDPKTERCVFAGASFGVNGTCVRTTQSESLRPGSSCSWDGECASNSCTDGLCQGKMEGEFCESHEDCGTGLSCQNLSCQPQAEFDHSCISDFDCVNNCVCSRGLCAFYYSLQNGVPADNPVACESGYIADGSCAKGLVSRFLGQPCTGDSDCAYQNDKGEVVAFGVCQCGFNPGAFSYCPPATGDGEFRNLTNAVAYILASNAECHTLDRFGPCSQLNPEDIKDYQQKKMMFENYAELIMNDACVAKTLTYTYWQSVLAANLPAHALLLLAFFQILL